MILCVLLMHAMAWMCSTVSTKADSLLPPWGSRGSNSGHQTWLQMPLPAEPSHPPDTLVISLKLFFKTFSALLNPDLMHTKGKRSTGLILLGVLMRNNSLFPLSLPLSLLSSLTLLYYLAILPNLTPLNHGISKYFLVHDQPPVTYLQA